jgi:hypothetical protein
MTRKIRVSNFSDNNWSLWIWGMISFYWPMMVVYGSAKHQYIWDCISWKQISSRQIIHINIDLASVCRVISNEGSLSSLVWCQPRALEAAGSNPADPISRIKNISLFKYIIAEYRKCRFYYGIIEYLRNFGKISVLTGMYPRWLGDCASQIK